MYFFSVCEKGADFTSGEYDDLSNSFFPLGSGNIISSHKRCGNAPFKYIYLL